ncbi:MAG: 8-amino-3,8-dideoxy-alpha-D-manno-octulosonate transaminase [Bacteroidota bacterium]|nr:8-amino-3,8-dideoxy-alpha-D-manno-octulosonate transaminase [Bacteroidota bacterium]
MPGFEIFGDEERKEVMDVLDTGVLFRYGFVNERKGNWKVKSFEDELCAKTMASHALLCSSGTAALQIALAASGIGAGDEVIVPPFTFIATIEAVLAVGAIPVFADIDDTLCLSPQGILAAITPKTKAVIPVHMCGSMARIDEIKDICNKNELLLIEDACQSFGGSFKGKALGTFGLAGCYSFDSVKTITCGEGGAVVTDDERIGDLIHAYHDHGHDHIGNDRGKENHNILGFNYRISEINAAIGLAQIRKIDSIIEKQRQFKNILEDSICKVTGITMRTIPDLAGDTATFLSFFLPDEDTARRAASNLIKNSIDGVFYWYDNNWHYIRNWNHLLNMKTAYKLPQYDLLPDYSKYSLPESDKIAGRLISLQIKLGLSIEEVYARAEKISKILGDSI